MQRLFVQLQKVFWGGLLWLGLLGVWPQAQAADFSLGGGLSFAAGSSGSSLQGSAQFSVRNLVQAPPVALHLRAGADGSVSGGFALSLQAGPLLEVGLQPLNLYAGPTLGVRFSDLGTSGPLFGLVAGLELPTGNVYTYAELVYTFNGPAPGFGLRGGVNIRL